MIAAILAPLFYVLVTCLAKRLNVVDYIIQNKVSLGLTVVVLVLLSVFGKVGLMIVITTFLVPYLLPYSIASLSTKLVEVWANIQDWFTGTFNKPKAE